MKKNTTKNLVKLLGSSVIIGSTVIATTSCQKKEKENNITKKNEIIEQPKQAMIKGDVNYVAIGDQWSSSAEISLKSHEANYFNKERNEIYGLSYASYLANAIHMLDDEYTKLSSFYNFSLANTTIDDWLYLLNPTKYSSFNQNHFDYNLNVQKDLNEMIENQAKLAKLFNNFQLEDNKFSFLSNSIANANFMTISLGFNDFFKKQELLDIVFHLTQSKTNEETQTFIQNLITQAQQRANLVYTKINLLIKELRKINEHLNINIIGYATPYLKLAKVIENSSNKNVLFELTNVLNKSLETASKDNNINFFSYTDNEYLNKNISYLSDGFLSVKPNVLAIKKMIQDIFMKMSLSENDYINLIQNYYSHPIIKSLENTNIVNESKQPNPEAQPIVKKPYYQVFDFKSKPTSIKTQIVGVLGDNVTSFKKEYEFEKINDNQVILNKLLNQKYDQNILRSFKYYFNNGKNVSNEMLIDFFNKIVNIIGFPNEQFLPITNKLNELLTNAEFKEFVINLINNVCDNKYLNKQINKLNYDIDVLFKNTLPNEIQFDQFKQAIANDLTSADHIFAIFKEISVSGFLLNSNNQQHFKTSLRSILDCLFNKDLINKLFNAKLDNIVSDFLEEKTIKQKMLAIFDDVLDEIINNPVDYFENIDTSLAFLNKILASSNTKITELIKTILDLAKQKTVLIQDKQVKVIDVFKQNMIDVISAKYLINNEHFNQQQIDDFKYFVNTFIDNFNSFEKINDFVSLAVQTFIKRNQENLGNKESLNLISQTIYNLFDNESNNFDVNKSHKLLFAFLSFKPNHIDETKYQNGLNVLGISFIKTLDALRPQNLTYLTDNNYRNNLINLFKNILKADANLLNAQAKNFFNATIDSIFNDAFAKNSLLQQIYNHVIEYLGVFPITNYLREKHLEAEILANSEFANLEDYVKNWFYSIYDGVISTDLVDSVKYLIHDIINNNQNYQFNEPHELLVKIFKQAPNNQFPNIIASLIKNIVNNDEIWNKGVDILFGFVKDETKTTFTNEEKTSLKSFIRKMIGNIPDSKFFSNFVAHINKQANKLVVSDIANINDFVVYLKENILTYFSFNNQTLVNEILDVIFVKDKSNISKVESKELIKNLSIILSKETLINYIFNKLDIKTIILNAIDQINLDSLGLDSIAKNDLITLLVDLKSFINEKWDSIILIKIKQLITRIFSKENVDRSNTLEEFIVNGLNDAKSLLKEITGILFDEFLFDKQAPDRIQLTTQLILTIVKQKVPDLVLKPEKLTILNKTLEKLIRKLYKLNVHNSLIENFISKITENINNFGFDTTKYNFQDLINIKALLSAFNPDDVIAFINDDLNNEDIRNIIQILFDNTSFILSKISFKETINSDNTNPNETTDFNADSSTPDATASSWNQETIIRIIKAILNKLSKDDKLQIINESSETIKTIVRDKQINEVLKDFIKKALLQIERPILDEMVHLDRTDRNVDQYAKSVVDILLSELINDENISLFKEVLTHMVLNGDLYTWNTPQELLIKVLKNINQNSLSTLVDKLINNITHNDDLLNKVNNVLLALIKIKTNTTLSSAESEKLTTYIKEVLKNLDNATLFNHLKTLIYNTLANNLTGNETFEELKDLLINNIKEDLKNNNELINQIFEITLVSDKYNINEVIQVAKVLMDKETFVDWIFNTINIKKLVLDQINNIAFDQIRFNQATLAQLEIVKTYLKDFFNEKYNTFIVPLAKELIANLFSNEVALKATSFHNWVANFIKQNKTFLLTKINDIFENFVNGEKGSILKNALATFLVELMDQDLQGVEFGQTGKQSLISTLEKLMGYIPSFKLFDGLVPNVLDVIVKNLETNRFNFATYDFAKTINLVAIINKLNFDNIDHYIHDLTSQELKNVMLLLLNNIDKFSHIIQLSPTESNNNSDNVSEPNSNSSTQKRPIIVFEGNITININVFFNLFKSVFTILNEEDRQEVIAAVPKLSTWFINEPNMRIWVNQQLQKIKQNIPNLDQSGIELADEIIKSIDHIIFEDQATKDLVDSLLISLISINHETFETINDFNQLFSYLIRTNKPAFKSFVNHIIDYMLSNEETVDKTIQFILDWSIKEYHLDTTSDQINHIKSLLKRVVMKLGSLNIVESLIDDFLELTTTINILDNDGHFNQQGLIGDIINTIKSIQFSKYLTTANIEDLLETILDKTLDVSQLESELWALYSFIVHNLNKFNKKENNSLDVSSSAETNPNEANTETNNAKQQAFLAEVEKLLFNGLSALNGSIKQDNVNGKTALGNVLYRILKDQISALDYSLFKNPVLSTDVLKSIITKVVNYNETKNIIDTLINDFMAGSKVTEASNFGELLSKIILKIKDNLKQNITNVILKFAQDDEIINIIIDNLVQFMKLENITPDDKTFLATLIKDLIPELTKTELYQRKFLNRTIVQLAKHAKDFDIANPSKWLQDAFDQVTSVFSFNDVLVIIPLIGDNRVVTGDKLVKLINIFFGKSNFENSVLYNALRNLNQDPDVSKRTTMKYLNDQISNTIKNAFKPGATGDTSDPDNITVSVDIFRTIDTLYKMMANQLNQAIKRTPGANDNYHIRAKLPEYQAMYRFTNVINFALFEMFGRETLVSQRDSNGFINLYSGVRSILWELQEGTNIKAIPGLSSKFAGMQYYLEEKYRREMNNYIIDYHWEWSKFKYVYDYYNEDNYGPDSIMYLIVSSGYNEKEKNKLKPFKFKISKNGQPNEISKKEYILLTLKEGGFAKFMALNNQKSISKWSHLKNTTKFE
ncbi:hypothetical protein [[Mycoplasma] anseris]|uniref:Lipoprotein n=1 Tax=[Mycoplasma] anseris TaxID=92400 RepID=A0A2Z4NDE2_9BACT|nr:hypothetical protein [[Mycoplasma] anseris]AWX69547.1 hypothetical protein DP065_02165 [[Mycoplasma] anseris]